VSLAQISSEKAALLHGRYKGTLKGFECQNNCMRTRGWTSCAIARSSYLQRRISVADDCRWRHTDVALSGLDSSVLHHDDTPHRDEPSARQIFAAHSATGGGSSATASNDSEADDCTSGASMSP
jgi:hypothetical protein